MQKYGIPMVNLYKICEMNLQKASNDGIHWKREAYMLMADKIIEEIERNLAGNHKD